MNTKETKVILDKIMTHTPEELQSRIDLSEAAIKADQVISQEYLEKEAENW